MLLLYRAAESHPDYKCYFGLATSNDGYHFERVSDQPALSPSVEGFDGATIQDPRIIKMGDWFYVTYACRHYPVRPILDSRRPRRYATPDCGPEFPHYLRTNATLTGLAMTRDFKTWIRAGWITDPLLDDRDAILFPEKIRRQVRDDAPAAGMGRREVRHRACLRLDFEADDLLGFRTTRVAC